MKIGDLPIDILTQIAIDAFENDPLQKHQDFSTVDRFLHEAFLRIRRNYPYSKTAEVLKDLSLNRQITQFLATLDGQESVSTLAIRPRIYFDDFDPTPVLHRVISETSINYPELARVSRRLDLEIDVTRLVFALTNLPFTTCSITIPMLLLIDNQSASRSLDDLPGRCMKGVLILFFSVQLLLLVKLGTFGFQSMVAKVLQLLRGRQPGLKTIQETWQALLDQE